MSGNGKNSLVHPYQTTSQFAGAVGWHFFKQANDGKKF